MFNPNSPFFIPTIILLIGSILFVFSIFKKNKWILTIATVLTAFALISLGFQFLINLKQF